MKKDSYNPLEFEGKIQDFWINSKKFKTKKSRYQSSDNYFSMIMPPPNITGKLHLGHAWDLYFQDTLLRFKKLSGFSTDWFGGLDHAGIATQSLIEKRLFEKGITREELGEKKFVNEIEKWKDQNSTIIKDQWNKLGILPNDEVTFTLDDEVNKLVIDSFIKLYKRGYIYQGKKLVNWDMKLKTAISNIEVEYKQTKLKLFDIKYKFDNSDKYIIISTTRPETIFGDTGVFVNPNDKRYKDLIGKNLINPLNGKKIKIFADEYVKTDFGTGIMKVTPAHDFNDEILGKKHKLEFINIFTSDGKLNSNCGKFEGLEIGESRKKILSYLESKNLYNNEFKEYQQEIGYSQRSKTVVQPILSNQWFLDLKKAFSRLDLTLSKLNLDRKDAFDFIPKKFWNLYNNWTSNLDDWCISRQLWWGHKIPVWFNKTDSKKVLVQKDSPGKEWIQTSDVLDTWFSSSLLPLIYKEKINDYLYKEKIKYITNSLFTGYDIIFFWVTKMIIMTFLVEKNIESLKSGKLILPFKNIIIHGLIRDESGRKMSKSLNNGIDPIEIINKYGSDPLRFYLLTSSSPGNDIRFSIKKLETDYHLCNKIYNIKNFFQSKEISFSKRKDENIFGLNIAFSQIFKKLEKLINDNFSTYNFSFTRIHVNLLISYFSKYLNYIRISNNKNLIYKSLSMFLDILKLIHPFFPFLTEEIFRDLNLKFKLTDCDSIIDYNGQLVDFLNKEEQKIIKKSDEKLINWDDLFFGVLDILESLNIKEKSNFDAKIYIIEYLDVFKRAKANSLFNKVFNNFNAWIKDKCNVELVFELKDGDLFNTFFITQFKKNEPIKKYVTSLVKYENNNLVSIDELKSKVTKNIDNEIERSQRIISKLNSDQKGSDYFVMEKMKLDKYLDIKKNLKSEKKNNN